MEPEDRSGGSLRGSGVKGDVRKLSSGLEPCAGTRGRGGLPGEWNVPRTRPPAQKRQEAEGKVCHICSCPLSKYQAVGGCGRNKY